jgi:ribonucleoside-diphosphate reductase alpha chain
VYGGDDVQDGLADRHAGLLQELFGGRSRAEMDNGTTQLRLGSGAVRALFSGLGVTSARAHQKTVPEAVFTAPTEVQAAFLRGLFGADGCVSAVESGKASRYVGLGSRSRDLLIQVQQLLEGFGIRSRIYDVTTWKPQPFQHRRKSGELTTYAVRPGFDLRITGSDMGRFATLVGFSTPRKQSRLEEIISAVSRYRTKPTTHLVACVPGGSDTVYNLTEPLHHSYIVNGFVVANCSEYMFLDDSACNLASINLLRFLNDDGSFAIDDYRHAVQLTITAQEIVVSPASYPTEKIGKNSEAFRPLGLGYANLGALLMAKGIPYDSPRGRDLAACLTAILTGEGYAQSARIAREVGPFDGYAVNRQPMLRVMAKHREAAYAIPSSTVDADLLAAARATWDEAHELGARHGYRNGQISVIAPTGTISFMLDCDTTGVEPDIALVKYKKLVGGGMLKIVNNTVPAALKHLGYGEGEVADIVAFIDANDTIEGAPKLRDDDLPVFDCAFTPRNGQRSIAWQGHVRMMAAVQPFVSGAISKTVNMPNESTVEDVEKAYIDGWRMGLKALAIYRDGSKRSQPLATSMDKTTGEKVRIVERPLRRKLPAERQALTHRFEIGGHEGYITVGLYEDGTPGEIFVKMAKEGSTVSGLTDSFAIAVSFALQYGVPLDFLVNKFAHMRFEPQGFTRNPEIPIAKSIVDYIFRWLGSRFLSVEKQTEIGIIRRDGEETEPVPAVEGPANAAQVLMQLGLEPVSPTSTFQNQADAPSCSECGSLMVRSGSCYKCHNCGATSGCS